MKNSKPPISPLARATYRKILSLRLAEAGTDLQTLQTQEPAVAPFLENYLDFFAILTNDDEALYHRQSKQLGSRLDRLARGDARSPYYLYMQAEIRLQWAVLQLRYGDYLAGLKNVRQGHALLSENRRRFPAFAANLKSLGILHALVGNVPDEYRWAVHLLAGIRGSVQQGLDEVAAALAAPQDPDDFSFETETRVACAFLLLHLKNDKNAAWQTLRKNLPDPALNPLTAFAQANMALRTGRNDEAIRLLEACPEGGPFYPFPYRHYLLGMAKLQRLDADADQALERFAHTLKGKNGLKEAYQKLAWHQLVRGNPAGYRAWLQLVKTRGNDRSEPDKAALHEAKSGELPDPLLLRARLLFDGGYLARARTLLKNAANNYTAFDKKGVEFRYRMGRIAHELGAGAEAVEYYNQTIGAGAGQPWYFACNAALQLGLLYERQGDRAKARAAFRHCLRLQPEVYAASLHARAKAGLGRL